MIPPPIEQYGASVLIQGREPLAALHFCIQAGIIKAHCDGHPKGHLEAMKAAVRHAVMSASGHEVARYVAVKADSQACRDAELFSIAEASAEVGLSQRQTRRLAAQHSLGQRVGNSWMLTSFGVSALRKLVDKKRNDGSYRIPAELDAAGDKAG